MKVGHVLRKYDPREWGGTETVIHQLLDGLRDYDVQSEVYCPVIDDYEGADPLADSGCTIKRFKVFLPFWGLDEELKRQVVAVGGNFMSFGLIKALAKSADLSLIHTHTFGHIGGIARTIAKRRRIPLVVSIHGGILDLSEGAERALAAPMKRTWHWGKPFGFLLGARKVLEDADAIIVLNHREADLLRDKYPNQQIVVMPNSVRVKDYEADRTLAAREAYPELANKKMLLTLGRIDPVKNQQWLVERMPQILGDDDNVILVLAGAVTDAAYGKTMMKRIDELGLRKNVLLTGGLPPGDPRLIGLLQLADAVILPSLSETFGIVILEAWAAGSVVLSSSTSGPSELIENEKNGRLFELDNVQSFHSALEEILSNPEKASQMAKNAQEKVVGEFDTSLVVQRVHQLYKDLIEAK